jgi:hypothetical protein
MFNYKSCDFLIKWFLFLRDFCLLGIFDVRVHSSLSAWFPVPDLHIELYCQVITLYAYSCDLHIIDFYFLPITIDQEMIMSIYMIVYQNYSPMYHLSENIHGGKMGWGGCLVSGIQSHVRLIPK